MTQQPDSQRSVQNSAPALPLAARLRPRFPDVVLGACALGFAFLLAELIGYQHWQKGTQIIGFVSVVAGLLLTLLGFVRAPAVRKTVLVLLGLLTLTGLLGVYEHHETRTEDAARFARRQAAGQIPKTGPDGQPRTFESNIPQLAPLSLSGLAGLAFLALLVLPARGAEEMPGEARPS